LADTDGPAPVVGPAAVGSAWTDFAAAGEHTLVIVPVYWTAPDAQTTTTLRALARQTGDYWSEQTGGAVTVPDAKISVFNWLRIPDPVTCSDRDAIFFAARDAATAASGTYLDSGSYHRHVLVYFPRTSDCPWDGTASVGDEGNIFNKTYGRIWINGYTSGDVWEREFGHNLSLGHASTAKCRDAGVQVPLSATCDTRDSSDYDLMGQGRGHDGFTLNTALADRIGMLGPTAVRTASVGASFTLSPVASHTGLLAVKVPLADSVLYVEYRPSAGRDAAQPSGWSGVQVRQRNTWDYSSRVLALTPDGADGLMANVAARPGVDWRIPGTYLTLVVDHQDASGASIRFAAPPDTTPPPAPDVPTVGGTATVSGVAERDGIIGGDLFANWPRLDDPESGLASFRVYVDDVLVQTVAGTASGASLPALSAGVHRLRVDATNNVGLTTAGAEASFHNELAPPAPAAPTISTSTPGEAALDWAAVADAALTGYQIVVDELPVGTAGAAVTHYGLGAQSPGSHSARVVAVNALGLGVTSAPTFFSVAPPAAPTVRASLAGVAGTGGWWKTATVRFACTSADDTLVCPAERQLPDGGNQQAVQFVTDQWQQTGRAEVRGVYVDGTAPRLAVTGVSNRAVYTRGAPRAGCTATDATAGLLRPCTVVLSAPRNRVVTFTASATDKAGNRATVVGTYTVWPSSAAMNASLSSGRYAVRAGGRYTVTVNQASARSPQVYAPSTSTRPQGRPLAVRQGSGGNWTVTVTVPTSWKRGGYGYVVITDGEGVARTLGLYVR
jgi:hypothetical protein